MDRVGSILSVAGLGILFGLPVLIGMAARAYNLRKISDLQVDTEKRQLARQLQQRDRDFSLTMREERLAARERQVEMANTAQYLQTMTETPIQRAASVRWNEITSEILSGRTVSGDRSLFAQMYEQSPPPARETGREPAEESAAASARTETGRIIDALRAADSRIRGEYDRRYGTARRYGVSALELHRDRAVPAQPTAVAPAAQNSALQASSSTSRALATLTQREIQDIMCGDMPIRPNARGAGERDIIDFLSDGAGTSTVTQRTRTLPEHLRETSLVGKAAAAEPAKAEPESKLRAERATNNIRRMQTTVELAFDEEQEDARG